MIRKRGPCTHIPQYLTKQRYVFGMAAPFAKLFPRTLLSDSSHCPLPTTDTSRCRGARIAHAFHGFSFSSFDISYTEHPTHSLPSPIPQPHSRPSTIRSFLIVHMFSGWRSATVVRIALVVLQPDVNSFLDFPLTLPSVSVIVTTLKKSFWD